MGYPNKEDEITMLKNQGSGILQRISPIITAKEFLNLKTMWQEVTCSDVLYDYLQRLVEATRHHEKIALGLSPRASLTMVKCAKAYAAMMGRDYVLPDDIKTLAIPVFAHRLIGLGASYTRAVNTSQLIQEILDTVEVPSEHFKTTRVK